MRDGLLMEFEFKQYANNNSFNKVVLTAHDVTDAVVLRCYMSGLDYLYLPKPSYENCKLVSDILIIKLPEHRMKWLTRIQRKELRLLSS